MSAFRSGIRVLGVAVLFACGPRASIGQTVIFTDSFENPTAMSNWTPWFPRAAQIPGYGPNALFQSDNHPHTGIHNARQEQGQPGWWGSIHMEPGLANSEEKLIRASVWQFEDYDKKVPLALDHYQVQGWLALMDGDDSLDGGMTEFFAIGVHAHRFSPPPVLDWWTYFAYGTALDGWKLTSVPRSQGFHKLGIAVHPYTGQMGDVEFFIDDQLVGLGRRQPGPSVPPRGVQLTRIGLGANHTLITEDYVANTYEFFYYDDVEISVTPVQICPNPELRFDGDNDGDVDLDDFGVFQACFTGTAAAYDFAACRCMNSNPDQYIDSTDFFAFEACRSAPAVLADVSCDDSLPPP